jgi:hypothetical protein
MSKTLVISESLFAQLEVSARNRGLSCIEELLAQWQRDEDDPLPRTQLVHYVDSLRQRTLAVYGEMPEKS